MIDELIVRKKYEEITLLLIEKKLTITTMESCTAGEVASLLTDTEGSSAVLKGAFVTYSNEAKIMQGVPGDVIERFGVYSEETAKAMAEAAGRAYGADIAIGVTGTMGNVDPVNSDSRPGKVYFAIAFRGDTKAFSLEIEPQETRHGYKICVADVIADKIRETMLYY